jgi:NAD(P)-dependent dehydrogenase (short-subunit alcohol dehydrogenase family)
MTMEDWNWMLGVNLWGTIHGVQAFLPYLAANPDGAHVAATISIGGFTTMPMLVPYSVSKYAVVALLEGLRLECEKDGLNIGVTLLAPGPTRSNIHKSMRNRPATMGDGGFVDLDLDELDAFEGGIPWKEPIFAGKVLADAIEANRLYVTTHPDSAQEIYDRLHRIEDTLKLPI